MSKFTKPLLNERNLDETNAALCYKGAIEYTTEKMIVRRQVQLKLGPDVQAEGGAG